MVNHLNIHVYGRVQGVFFRSNMEAKARELKLAGFVRNEPDGSVYIEAEGEEKALEELLNWCKDGVQSARVERVESTKGKITNSRDFKIAY